MSLIEEDVVQIEIHDDELSTPIRRIWAGIGYDEINWTYTPRGSRLLERLGGEVFRTGRYWVRCHNAFTTGNGLSWPAWGSGNVCHRGPSGELAYDWSILDRVYDTIIRTGGTPLVELGFMPRDLGRRLPEYDTYLELDNADADGFGYQRVGFAAPPQDIDEWKQLVREFMRHLIARYSEEEVETWRFEVWNEPNIRYYWMAPFQEYLELWNASAEAAREVLPNVSIGGPATAERGDPEFMREYCKFVTLPGNQLPSFISLHTKGAYYPQRSISNPFATVELMSPSSSQMLRDIDVNIEVITSHELLRGVPVVVDEFDPAVGTIHGVHDNPNFIVTNSEYYSSFATAVITDVLSRESVDSVVHWSFYMEGKRWFEGNRVLIDNADVAKPFLNALVLMDRLALGQQVRVRRPPEATRIRCLASRDDGITRVLVVNHDDQWWADYPAARITIRTHEKADSAVIRRIDRTCANGFREWERLGSQDWPDTDAIDAIHAASQISAEMVALRGVAGGVEVDFDLPLHGVALLEFK